MQTSNRPKAAFMVISPLFTVPTHGFHCSVLEPVTFMWSVRHSSSDTSKQVRTLHFLTANTSGDDDNSV